MLMAEQGCKYTVALTCFGGQVGNSIYLANKLCPCLANIQIKTFSIIFHKSNIACSTNYCAKVHHNKISNLVCYSQVFFGPFEKSGL